MCSLSTLCYLITTYHSVCKRFLRPMLLNFNCPVNIKLLIKTNCKNNYNEVNNTSHTVTRTTSPQVKCEAVTRLKQVCSHQCRQILRLVGFSYDSVFSGCALM